METWKMIEPVPGDHIRVLVKGYYHHGIYIGNDEVVQFGLPFNLYQDHSEIAVIKSPIEDFLNGGFLEVRVCSKKELKEKFSNKKIVEIAVSKIGEKGYNLLYNNCEHFANLCVFGKKISYQVENIHEQIKNVLNKK